MTVKIQWEIYTAEAWSNGTWKSNSPTLEELLNAIAGPEKIKEPTKDIAYSMARLAIRGLPYFKITEISSEPQGKKNFSNQYIKNVSCKANPI
jgi:hypothetical protein